MTLAMRATPGAETPWALRVAVLQGTRVLDERIFRGDARISLGRTERATFQRLNADYVAKHGFPFIIAVRDNTKASILTAFAQRIGNDTETEFATACRQVERIAELRPEHEQPRPAEDHAQPVGAHLSHVAEAALLFAEGTHREPVDEHVLGRGEEGRERGERKPQGP